MKRKLIALLLTLCLLASMLPSAIPAEAAEPDSADYNRFHVSYDMNGGSVFWSKGTDDPEGTGEDFIQDGDWTQNVGKTKTVHFLLDPNRSVDRDAYSHGEFRTYQTDYHGETPSLNVRVGYGSTDGWQQLLVVRGGALTEAGQAAGYDLIDAAAFGAGAAVLSFQAESENGEVWVDVWWTDADYSFYSFEPGEGQLALSIAWGGNGGFETDPDLSGLPETDILLQEDHNRARVLLPQQTPSVTFTFDTPLRRMNVDLQEGWVEYDRPAAMSYTYVFDCVENGDPWNYYNINFEFADDMNSELRVYYDVWGGSVYQSLGQNLPVIGSQDFLFDGQKTSFREEGVLQTVRLRFDQTMGVDREAYEGDGSLRSVPSNVEPEDRALYVYARYVQADGEDYDGWVVENGVSVNEAFAMEGDLLSFTPANVCDVELEVFWTDDEYDYRSFEADDGAYLIECNVWGDGTLIWDENQQIDARVQYDRCRVKILVPDALERLELTWTGHLRTFQVFGLGGGWEPTEWNEPDFGSYELVFNQTEEDGSPRRHYQLNFDFASEEEWNFLYGVNYDFDRGSVFYYTDYPQGDDQATYLPRQGEGRGDWPDNVSFNADGQPATVYLLLDPAHRLDYDAWGRNELNLIPCQSEGKSISVVAKFPGLDGEWHEDVLVEKGLANEDLASFENGLLIWQPESGYGVDFEIFWTEADFDFYQLSPNDGEIMVEYDRDGNGALTAEVSPGDALLDTYTSPDGNRVKLRLTDQAQSLLFRWDGMLRRIEGENISGDGEGRWEDRWYPPNEYVYQLNCSHNEEEPWHNYYLRFEFDWDWTATFGVWYDDNGGLVYETVGEGEERYVPNWNNDREGWPCEISFTGEDGGPVPIQLRFDTLHSLDFDQWDNSEFGIWDTWSSPDRAISVVARFIDPADHEWRDEILVLKGELFSDHAAFENNVLTFLPYSSYFVEFHVYWTRQDYDFSLFDRNESFPILVEAKWWGNGQIELVDDDEGLETLEGEGRMRVRVEEFRQTLTFQWDPDSQLRRLRLDGNDLGLPEGGTFTLELEPHEPGTGFRDWYNLEFEFEGFPMGNEGKLWFSYDDNRGAVFCGLEDDEPACDGTFYRPSDWEDRLDLFDENGEPRTIHVLLDEQHALDRDQTEAAGEIVLRTSDQVENRQLYVFVRSNELYGLAVDDYQLTDAAAEHGYELAYDETLQCWRLDYTPSTDSDMELRVYWVEEDYDFGSFESTEAAPVLIELNWWGNGSVTLPTGIEGMETFLQEDRGRARLRVPANTESLTFTWSEDAVLDHVEADCEGVEAENSYTLLLEQPDENGNFRDWYHINFVFEGGWQQQEGMLISFADTALGSIFWALGEDELTADGEHLLGFGFGGAISYRPQGETLPVRLLFDGQQAPEYDDAGNLIGFVPAPYREDRAITIHAESEGWEGKILDRGLLTELGAAHGFAFDAETGILSFTPESETYLLFHVNWTVADAVFDEFQGTEDYPVVVQFYWHDYGELDPFPDIPAENVFLQPEYQRGKVLLPADAQSLTFTWGADYGVHTISYVDWNFEEHPHNVSVDQSEPHSFTFYLSTEPVGARPHNYQVDFYFFPDSRWTYWVNVRDSEGTVFYALNEDPERGLDFLRPEYPAFNAGTPEAPVLGEGRFLLDPHHGVHYREDGNELYDLPAWEGYSPSVWMEYPLLDGTDNWFEGWVVEGGQLTQAGQAIGVQFTLDYQGSGCSLLAFTPKNEKPVILQIFWSQMDRDFYEFDAQEGKPCVVDVYLDNRAPVTWPEDIPAGDVLFWEGAEHNFLKLRLPADARSLELSWAHAGMIRQIQVPDEWWNPHTWNAPAGTSFTLPLDHGEDNHYFVDIYAYEWAFAENRFDDVSEDAWYREAVAFAQCMGITSGTSDTTFSPNQAATRAQLMTFLWIYQGRPAPEEPAENPFADVSEDAWYRDAVLWAWQTGVTAGTSANTFGAADPCTRAQAVTFLWIAHGRPEPEGTDCPFTDVPDNAYYRKAVLWAVEQGITTGTTAATFSPNQNCTRAQAVTFLFRDFLWLEGAEDWARN